MMGFIETQSSDPGLTYKSNFQILYNVMFFWLEQHGLERFPIFHQNEDILGGSQPIDLLKSPGDLNKSLFREQNSSLTMLRYSFVKFWHDIEDDYKIFFLCDNES